MRALTRISQAVRLGLDDKAGRNHRDDDYPDALQQGIACEPEVQ